MIFDENAKNAASFLAVMSHELRTPMQSVFGMLELIERDPYGPETRQMVKAARASAASLLEILDDVLDLAKIDANKMELETIEMPVRTLVQGVLEALQVRTHGRAITLKDDIAEDVPKIILGDPKRLRQVLMNLTGNALKFTEKGSVSICVTAAQTPNANQVDLKFDVVDTGIGMDESVLGRIFEPFVQADSSTARKYGGTGLGLPICKKLVERMGGKLSVTSVKGQGSRFSFNIPASIVAADDVQDLPDLTGLSVLSVEDHPQGALEIMRSLKSMGAAVENVGTVAEAQKILALRPFDIAIIDQGLPDGLGIDLVRHIIGHYAGMGLLMYTVRDDEGLKQELQTLGVTYLAKPSGRYKLGKTVSDLRLQVKPQKHATEKRVLLVEDTESVRLLVQKQLHLFGVQVDAVENGAQALQALQKQNYGLVISDLNMPVMDGFEMVRTIRAHETAAHLPVIVMTADVALAEGKTYLTRGFDEFLIKPISIGQIQSLLMRWGIIDALHMPKIDLDVKNAASTDPVDLAALAKQMGGNDVDALNMVADFIRMTEKQITNITNFAENNNVHALTEAAHSLKGAARSVCAETLADLAEKLQNLSEAGRVDVVLIKKVQDAFEEIKVFSNELLRI